MHGVPGPLLLHFNHCSHGNFFQQYCWRTSPYLFPLIHTPRVDGLQSTGSCQLCQLLSVIDTKRSVRPVLIVVVMVGKYHIPVSNRQVCMVAQSRYVTCTMYNAHVHNNNNNNNNHDDIYSAVIVAELLWEFTRFTRCIQHGARWPPTFGPSQPTLAASPPIGSQ